MGAQVAPDAAFAPYLTLGGTDSRHYTGLTPSVYRFSASRIDAADPVAAWTAHNAALHARTAHLKGQIPAALADVTADLLASQPDIRLVEVLAVK